MEVTDLVMLDLKQLDDSIHQNLVGVSNHRTLQFARYLAERNQKTWVRYVVVRAGLMMSIPPTFSVISPKI